MRASKIAYATMTDTDVSLYQTHSTYAQIEQQYGIKRAGAGRRPPGAGRGDQASSPATGSGSTPATSTGSRTTSRRATGPGRTRSATPRSARRSAARPARRSIDTATGKVVAINNTGNEDGERCTDNNPCEVDENGNVTVRQGINYAQETYGIAPCFGVGNKLDLSADGCALPKPAATRR